MTALSASDQALVADLTKKSGLVWVAYDGSTFAVWHEWVGDAVCIVSGGLEQQLPGISHQTSVTLLLRSKSTRALAAQIEAQVEVIGPDSEHWEAVTTALRAGRLNLHDSATAIERWARESVVVRLVPQGAALVPDAMVTELAHTTPRLAR